MPYRFIRTVDGRRGGLLTIMGLAYLLVGISNVFTADPPSVDLAFDWLPVHFTATTLGWMWIGGGALMTFSSLFSAPHRKLEATAFVVAMLVAFLWGFIFVVSFFFGNPFGLRGGVVYLAWAAFILYVSGWANPVTVRAEKG